jgi:hypothetical protein
LLLDAIDIFGRCFGPESLPLATALLNLGESYRGENRITTAAEARDRGLAIFVKMKLDEKCRERRL